MVRDKELEMEEVKASRILGGAGKGRPKDVEENRRREDCCQ